MKRILAYWLFIFFIIASHSIWGLADLNRYPIKIGGANIYLGDLFFLSFILFSLPFILGKNRINDLVLSLKKPLLLLLFYNVMIIIYSLASGAGFNNTLRGASQLFYYAIYLGIPFLVRSRKELRVFILILLINILVAFFVVMYQTFTGWQPGIAVGATHFAKSIDMGGFYRTYNLCSQWLIFLFSFAYAAFVFMKKTLATLFLFAMSGMAMSLSFSRSAIAGFLVVSIFLLLVGFIKRREGLKTGKAVWTTLLVVLVMAYVMSFIYPVYSRIQAGVFEVRFNEGTFRGRTGLYENALNYLNESNILLGYGFMRLSSFSLEDEPSLLDSLQSGSDSGMIDLLFRWGIIGFCLYSFLHYRFVRISWKRIKQCESSISKVFFIGGISYTLFAWIQSASGPTFLLQFNSIIIIILWAVADMLWYFENDNYIRGTRTL
jgi:hypothetical protein